MSEQSTATSSARWYVVPATTGMPAYICTDPARHLETEIAVLYGKHGTEEAHRIADAVNALASNRSAMALPPAVQKAHPDTERLDWLEGMDVEVRTPLVHGSHHLFFAVPEQGDGDETPSKLRKQIDYERKGGEKP